MPESDERESAKNVLMNSILDNLRERFVRSEEKVLKSEIALAGLPEKVVRLEEIVQASERALRVALASMDKRMDASNEIRGALEDAVNSNISRTEFNVVKEAILADIRILRESKAMMDGKASVTQVNVALVIGFMALITSVMNFLSRFF
jgi:hypothetical protein